jgi:hypothetical protein
MARPNTPIAAAARAIAGREETWTASDVPTTPLFPDDDVEADAPTAAAVPLAPPRVCTPKPVGEEPMPDMPDMPDMLDMPDIPEEPELESELEPMLPELMSPEPDPELP